jgi:hypothetical protein
MSDDSPRGDEHPETGSYAFFFLGFLVSFLRSMLFAIRRILPSPKIMACFGAPVEYDFQVGAEGSVEHAPKARGGSKKRERSRKLSSRLESGKVTAWIYCCGG